jgi:arsenate reductase
MAQQRRVIFACVGNAFRSQMAEGFARHLGDPARLEVRSGGTMPAGFVHPAAIRLMKEKGIDISTHHSKPIDLVFAETADAVVTLCGPLDEACPAHIVKRVTDWTMDDPTYGDATEQRQARDGLETRVKGLLAQWGVLRDGL